MIYRAASYQRLLGGRGGGRTHTKSEPIHNPEMANRGEKVFVTRIWSFGHVNACAICESEAEQSSNADGQET
jgi:hypothetical protein